MADKLYNNIVIAIQLIFHPNIKIPISNINGDKERCKNITKEVTKKL